MSTEELPPVPRVAAEELALEGKAQGTAAPTGIPGRERVERIRPQLRSVRKSPENS